MDRGGKNDARKIEILQDYLSSYKPVTSQNFEVSVLRDNTLCFDSPLKRLNSFDSPVSFDPTSYESPPKKHKSVA